MANISWLVQSCCNPSVINYVEIDSFLLSEGVSFQDSLGNCYTVVEQSEEIPTIFFTDRTVYKDCLECTQENPCNPPVERPKKWLVESCCEKGVTKIIADNALIPGDIFQDINGNCYTVLVSTSGTPNIVRGNSELYRSCSACKPCVSPSPSVTPSLTQTPFPTQTVTPTITVTPSSTTYPLISKTPSPTPTATISVTPSPTVSVGSPECKCITFTNPGDIPLYAFYDECNGLQNVRVQIENGTSEQYCGGNPTANLGITITTGSACIGEQCVAPDITPTPTPTPSTTSVSGSLPEPDDLCMDVEFGPAPTPSTTPTATVSITPTVTVSTSTFPIYPSISPTPTISVTPSITPSVTPTISVSTTPSVTPSITPTRTVTPTISITPTATVSVTPTKTPTPTPTQSSSALVVQECSTLLIDTSGKTYVYNSVTNVSTLLPIPITFSSDIAHTTSKLWFITATPTGPNIIEYNITLNSFTATYNRAIPLPVGYTVGAGLCAIDNTTLISSVFPPFSTEQIVQITLNPDNTTTLTTLFNQISGRRISGDIIYTTDNKIILTTYTTSGPQYDYISQYTLVNGVWTLEFDLDITNTSPLNLGLATINNGICTFSYTNLKQVGTAFPYSVTQINNTGITVAGASQVPSCNNVSFQPNIIPASPSPTPTPTKTVTPSITVSPSVTPSRTPTPTPSPSAANSNCTGKLPLPGGSLVYNGVVVTASGTGNLSLYPNYLASCAVTSQTNTVNLGFSGPTLPFSYTLTFSQPVNNIKLILTAIGGIAPYVENLTFTTDIGTPTILSNDSCYISISGNTITGTGTNGGGTFAVSAPSSYTTLTVTGFGGGGFGNTPMSIDCNSIAPFQSSCASCDIQSLPVGGNGTVVSNNVTLTTTYSGPQIPTYIAPNPTQMTCVGLASPSPYQTVVLGYNSGAFIYTINFSQPVNNIKFLINGAGSSFNSTAFEYFTFNTTAGAPTLTSCGPSCGTTINNNTLQMGLVLPYGGGILAQVSAPSNYTQIIITGPGGLQGSTFALCADTAIPLPSPSPSITPSVTTTPSRTPSVTATPSISISKTPSVTPSITATPSITPSPSSGFASSCNTMLYRAQTGGYGSYNFTTNTPTTLNVAANPYPANDTTNNIPKVIANTSNKMWVYATGATTSEVNLRESDIVLSPFTSTFNRNITLPTGYKPANGLFALNNTTLVGTFASYNGVDINSIPIVELNIANNVATATTKCTLPYQNKPVGGLIVTTGANPKLLILTRFGANGAFFINQYDYTTGALEFKKIISPTVQVPSGLVEINGNVYIIGSNVYKIDTVAPYNLTLIQTVIGNQIINTSQLASCIDTIFSTGSCDTCNIGILSQNNILTYNGVTIVPSYVGPLNAYANGIYTEVDSNCINTNSFSIPAGSITLGQYASTVTSAPFTYTLTFSQPVNNIKLAIGGMGGVTYTTQESFAFTTNGGTPTLASCKGCFGSINGNTITASLADSGVVSNGISAGGILTITAPTNYTTLTISGPGGVYGSTFALCTDSISPVTSPSPSPSPSLTPTPTPSASPPSTGLLGCVYYSTSNTLSQPVTYNYNPFTNVSTQVTLPGSILSTFAETHTSTKYWKGNQTSTIKEWIPTNDPTTLAFNRNITISGITSAFGNYFIFLQAINDTTLLTTIAYTNSPTPAGNFTFPLIRMDITNNTVTPAQMTTLFNIYAPAGLDSILLTSTNKLLTIGRRNTPTAQEVTYLSQYSYPDGALELDIDISSTVLAINTQRYLFESNGNLFVSIQYPNPTSTVYSINLNSPYTLTPVYTNMNLLGATFNSSINCNTVNLISNPSPSPTPSPSPSAPSSAFRTIYKYLDIQ